jgi:hypothetical protein
MEAYLYEIAIGGKKTLVLSINAADALEIIGSKAGTRSIAVAGKASFTIDDSGRIARYKLKSTTHHPNYGRDAIISHGVRASVAQENALQKKAVVLSQHETNTYARQGQQNSAKSQNHTKKSAKNKRSTLNPKFFISSRPLGSR